MCMHGTPSAAGSCASGHSDNFLQRQHCDPHERATVECHQPPICLLRRRTLGLIVRVVRTNIRSLVAPTSDRLTRDWMPQMKLVFNDQEMVRRRDDRLRHVADPEQEMRRLVSSSSSRIDSICSERRQILSSKKLGKVHASVIFGNLSFSAGQLFGRFGRKNLVPFKMRQFGKNGCSHLTAEIERALAFWLSFSGSSAAFWHTVCHYDK